MCTTAGVSAQAACASAFPAASLGQLFLWLHDTALIFIEAGQALASYAVHVADRLRVASAVHGKVRLVMPQPSNSAGSTRLALPAI